MADTAFAAVEASFLAAPPAAEYLHPLRVDRVGDTALLVFGWRSDPRWFAVRVDLPTRLEEVDDGPGVVIGSGPVDWADAVAGWLEEELLTGAVRGSSHREGDLVVLDIDDDRVLGDAERAYYLSRGTWGRVIDRTRRIDQESVPPARMVANAGFPTADLVVAGRDGTLVSWVLAWVNDTSGGPLVGQAVCVATGPAAPISATLVALDVAPAHSGGGLAERLLGAVLGDAADAGITTVDGIDAEPPAGSGWSSDLTRPARVHLDI